MRREHERRAGGNLRQIVDEDHAEVAEPVDDDPVVHDLVVAVHGRFEGAHHPREGLDRHLDAGAEPAGFGQQHLLDGHGPRLSAPLHGSAEGKEIAACNVDWSVVPPARVVAVTPESHAARRVCSRATRSSRSTARICATSSATSCRPTSRPWSSKSAAAGSSARSRSRSPRARRSGSSSRARCSIACAPATTTARSASSTSSRKGMRKSLSLKDDDYRLSFLYGNFTTLTRFTEADLERVDHREAEPALREHPRDRSRRAHAPAAQPPRRDEPALARRCCSTRASRCTARSSCAPISTTARSSTTRCSACSTASRRSRRSASCRSA